MLKSMKKGFGAIIGIYFGFVVIGFVDTMLTESDTNNTEEKKGDENVTDTETENETEK